MMGCAGLTPSGGKVTDPGTPVTRGGRDVRRWQALVVCLIAVFMTLLDVSIVNVALPSIQSGLRASPSALAWVVSGYALTFGLMLVPTGRVGDQRGRSRLFLIALLLFTAASALAGLSLNPAWLVGARLVQGAAGGMMNPQILGLLQDLFRGRERGRAFAMFGSVVGVSTAVGPLLGGLIIQVAGASQGWRWVFFVNLPIGVIGLVSGFRVLPEDRPVLGRKQWPDLLGLLLLAAGILCLLLPLVDIGGSMWYLLIAAPILLVAFALWEENYRRRGGAPLVDPRLFRMHSYAFGVALGLLYFAGFTSIFFVLALYFQRGLGYSALQAGLALTTSAVGSAVAAAYSGRLVHRLGRKLVIIGLCAALAGLIATDSLLAAHFGVAAGLVVAPSLLCVGIGSGLVIAPNQTVTLSEVDTTVGGTAAGVQQTGQRIGSALGIATASGLFFRTLAQGGYDVAITTGLLVSVGFVAAAFLTGIAEFILYRNRGK
jgi:EmrB/QacA subfamily drug resistance transporter